MSYPLESKIRVANQKLSDFWYILIEQAKRKTRNKVNKGSKIEPINFF